MRRTLKLADGDASAGAAHGADGGGNLDSTEANAVDAAGVGESSAPPLLLPLSVLPPRQGWHTRLLRRSWSACRLSTCGQLGHSKV